MSNALPEPLASDLMETDVKTLSPETTVDAATDFFIKEGISSAPVIKDGEFIGFISEADCLQALSNQMYFSQMDAQIGYVMKSHPICVGPDIDIFSLTSLFLQNNFRHIPVVEGGKLKGIVSRRDVLKGFHEYLQEHKGKMADAKQKVDYDLIMNRRFLVRPE